MSNGVAIGYGDASSSVRFMPVSPASGNLQGAQAVAGGLKHVSSALMQSSQDLAQLDAIRQREQAEASLFQTKAGAELMYSSLMTDGKKGFANRLDAENFMPEYEERWNEFYSAAMESAPAEVRPQMELELAKIRTAQAISLQGYGAQVARKSKIAGLDALAQVYEGQGRLEEAEQAILARPDLTPDEKFLGVQTMHARFADSRKKAEKAQREGEQARSYEGWFSAVKTQRGAMEFLVKAARPEDRDELIRSVGPAKYDALLKDAQEMADCDGTVAVSDAIRNGKVEDLRKAFEGGSWRADELDIINSIWKNEGRIDEDTWNKVYSAMEWDAVRCPDAPKGSVQMQQYQDAFKRKWEAMGVGADVIADKMKLMDEAGAAVYGKFDPSDAMSSLKGMNYLHPKTNIHRYADGDDADKRRLDGNMIAVQKDDAEKEVAHNERLILEAFNHYRMTDEGKKATKIEQEQKFYSVVTEVTGQNITTEIAKALEVKKNSENILKKAQQDRFHEFQWSERMPFLQRKDVPQVQTFDVEDLAVRGAVVPAAMRAAYGDSPLMMEIETVDKKVIRVPVVGVTEGNGIGVTESVAATVRGWEAKVAGGARVSVRRQSQEEISRYGNQKVMKDVFAPMPDHSVGKKILRMEARRDKAGRLAVYDLPAEDGGGAYEVAGINSASHPEEAARLKALIEAGKTRQAESEAAKYIESYTAPVRTWFDEAGVKDRGAEFYLRDAYFNSGPGGAARILQNAIGAKVSGKWDDDTRNALKDYVEKNGEENLIQALDRARADFYEGVIRSKPEKEVFREGWKNRRYQAQAIARNM